MRVSFHSVHVWDFAVLSYGLVEKSKIPGILSLEFLKSLARTLINVIWKAKTYPQISFHGANKGCIRRCWLSEGGWCDISPKCVTNSPTD